MQRSIEQGWSQTICMHFPISPVSLSASLSSSVAHLVVTVHIRLYCHDKVGGRGVTALKRREPRNLI